MLHGGEENVLFVSIGSQHTREWRRWVFLGEKKKKSRTIYFLAKFFTIRYFIWQNT